MIPINKQALQEVCKKYNIKSLAVFGSYARGDNAPASDIDLLVDFGDSKSLLELVDIENTLSDFMGRKVDLLTEGAISPYLIDKIKKELKPLYHD